MHTDIEEESMEIHHFIRRVTLATIISLNTRRENHDMRAEESGAQNEKMIF